MIHKDVVKKDDYISKLIINYAKRFLSLKINISNLKALIKSIKTSKTALDKDEKVLELNQKIRDYESECEEILGHLNKLNSIQRN